MVCYNFQRQFLRPVFLKTKTHTIRGDRKRHARPGERLQLQTGPRMRPVRFGLATCFQALPVRLDFDLSDPQIVLDGGIVVDVEAFARSDGFADLAAMRGFWKHVHKAQTFAGWLIEWGDSFEGLVDVEGIAA